MPVNLANMATKEASVTLAIGDETLTIIYYPNKVTTKSITIIDSSLDGLCEELCGIIKSWDLLNEDGTMYPLDAESLQSLGIGVLMQIARAISRDVRPN